MFIQCALYKNGVELFKMFCSAQVRQFNLHGVPFHFILLLVLFVYN